MYPVQHPRPGVPRLGAGDVKKVLLGLGYYWTCPGCGSIYIETEVAYDIDDEDSTFWIPKLVHCKECFEQYDVEDDLG